jgi:hypothetical protein
MHIIRMYTGADKHSHFENISIGFNPINEAQRKENNTLGNLQFVYQPPGFMIDMHPAPRKQFVITLQGKAEIILGDRTSKFFGPGDIILADDLTGDGHITRVVGDEPRISVQIEVE